MGFQDRGYSRDSHQPFMADWTAVMTIMVVNIALWVANLVAAGDFPLSKFLSLQGDLPRHLLKAWELVTYGFVHDPDDPWHLIGNMLGLWFFGRVVEDIMGRSEFYKFYFTAIVLAGLAWLASVQFGASGDAKPPMLMGASGGLMAVLAVFIWNYPRETVYIWGVLPVPAWALGLLLVVFDVQGASDRGSRVAHVAHIAGAIFGLCYAWRGWNLSGLGDMQDRLQTACRVCVAGCGWCVHRKTMMTTIIRLGPAMMWRCRRLSIASSKRSAVPVRQASRPPNATRSLRPVAG